jgi:flagellar hook-length control protein FliK
MSGEEQSGRHPHSGGGGEGAAGKIAGAGRESTSEAAPATPAAGVSAATQADASALSGNDLPPLQVDQLADAIASAATALDSPVDNVASPGEAAKATSAANTGPVKELDVQLNPPSLGALSIQMRLTNGNLNITIKADNSDTIKLIESERGSISSKLKSLEFSVESLTIKASDAAASSGASADAPNAGPSDYGEARQGQSGQTDDGARNGRSLDSEGQRRPAQQSRDAAGDSGGGDPGHRFV